MHILTWLNNEIYTHTHTHTHTPKPCINSKEKEEVFIHTATHNSFPQGETAICTATCVT